MSDSQAKITISAEDRATPVVQQVAQSLDQFDKSSKDATVGLGGFNAESVIATATGFSLANAAMQAVQAIKQFTIESVNAADSLQMLHNRAEVMFGSDFPRMAAQAEAMGQATGRSASELLNFDTNITTVGESLNLTKQQSEAMGQGLASLAVNLSKAYGVADSDAMFTLERALEGNTRGLRDYNIVLNTTVLQEYAHAEGINLKVSAMDAEQKAILTYHYLMDKTQSIQLEAIKNEGSLSDRTQTLGAQWEKLQQVLGSAALPAAKAGVDALTKVVDEEIVRVQLLAGAWSGVGQVLAGVLGGFGSSLLGGSGGSAGGTDKYFDNIVQGLQGSTLQFGKSKDVAADWAKGWVDNSGKAAKAAEALQQSMDALDQKYQDTAQSITDSLARLDQGHQDKMQSIADSMTTVQDSLKDLGQSFKDTMAGIDDSESDLLVKQDDKLGKLKDKLAQLMVRAEQENSRKGGFVTYQTNEEIDKTKAEITKEEAGRATVAGKMTPAQLADATRLEGMTDVERQFADAEKKRVADTAKYDESKGKLDDQQKKLDDKKKTEEDVYTAQRTQLVHTQDRLKEFHDKLVMQMNNMDDVTKDKVRSMTQQLSELEKAFHRAGNALLAKSGLAKDATPDSSGSNVPVSTVPMPTVPSSDNFRLGDPTSAYGGNAYLANSFRPPGKTEGAVSNPVTINMYGDHHYAGVMDAKSVANQIARQIQLQQQGIN